MNGTDLRLDTLADRLIERVGTMYRPEKIAISGAKSLNGVRAEGYFTRRAEIKNLEISLRALTDRIEFSDRFQNIAKEIEAQGHFGSRRKQVQDTAARRILTGLADGAGPRITLALKIFDNIRRLVALSRLQR